MSSASLEVLQIDKYDRHNVDSSRKAARSPAAHVARSTQIGATALISRSAAPRCRILFHLQLQHVIKRVAFEKFSQKGFALIRQQVVAEGDSNT